jgi:Cadherin domain
MVIWQTEIFQCDEFQILAKEVSQTGQHALSAMASVTVMVSDANDNAPSFQQPQYLATLQENATAGTHVAQVRAADADTGVLGEVRYTKILGPMNDSLRLDPDTGLITVASNNHRFDREYAQGKKFFIIGND